MHHHSAAAYDLFDPRRSVVRLRSVTAHHEVLPLDDDVPLRATYAPTQVDVEAAIRG